MEKQQDPGLITGIAGLLAVGAAMDYMSNEGRNIQKAIEWYHWLSSLDLITTPAEIAAQQSVAPAVVGTGLSPLAQLGVIVGFIVVGAVVVLALGIKARGGGKNATAQAQTSPPDEPFDKAASLARKQLASAVGPTVGLPKQRTSLVRKGARLVR